MPAEHVDLTLDSDSDEPQVTSHTRRYRFKDEFTPIRIDFPVGRSLQPSVSQRQPVASSSSKPAASTAPVASGSGSHGPLFVRGTPRRQNQSGPGPLCSEKAAGYNGVKRTAPDLRPNPAKRRKESHVKQTIVIDDDSGSDDIELITTPTPRGYFPGSSNSYKVKGRTSTTPQARHRSPPKSNPATPVVSAPPSGPIISLIEDIEEHEVLEVEDDDDIMEIEELPPPAPKSEPLELPNIEQNIEDYVSDDSEWDYNEISDQDEGGGYSYGLTGNMWKKLPERHRPPRRWRNVDAPSSNRYRSPLRGLDEDDYEFVPKSDGDSDQNDFEMAAELVLNGFSHLALESTTRQRKRGAPLGISRGRRTQSSRMKFELDVRERDDGKPLAASGSVLSIAQAPGYVAVGSTTYRGSIHDDAPDIDDTDDGGFANALGCLRVWDGVNRYPLPGHHREWCLGLPGRLVYRQRHYEVKEVAFDCTDPVKPYLLSAGGDGFVQIWHQPDPEDSSMEVDGDEGLHEEPSRRLELMADSEADGLRAWGARHCPTTLRLRSRDVDDRTLAVGCSNGKVYVYDNYLAQETWQHQAEVPGYELWPVKGAQHATGEVLWGPDPWLFASTESPEHGDHWAIDTRKRSKGKERLCDGAGNFVSDSGDAMALTDDLKRLALFTRSGKGKHTLYLYDLGKNDFKAATTLTLEPFSSRSEIASEVNCAKFSPDGLFLAVARNDNSFHVYDTRMWKEPIHRLQHDISKEFDKNVSIGIPNFGVTHLEWVQDYKGGGLGLVSGGGDGCVYLWDMLTAHSAEPGLLAEMQHGVATFSLGDRGDGEKRLVVGDCGGQVRFFD